MISTTGRDKGIYFVVIDSDNEGYVYLVDGLLRKLEKPKKKKIKHIEITSYHSDTIAEKITNKAKITNQDVKKVLKEIIRKI